MKYDVVIVGAGPAGLNCAYYLEKSKSVLVLEKNKTIGPKICGGGLTPNCYNYLKPPKHIIAKEFSKIKVHSIFQNRILDYKKLLMRTCDRETLANYQLKKLKNTTIKTNTKVTKITKDYILANNQKIYYKTLIGADGSNSIVRKYLKLKNNLTTTLQYKLPKDTFKDYEMFFNPFLIGPGYFWIIPHKDFVSVGCGTTKKYSKNILKNFHKWLDKQNIDYSTSKLESFPINCEYQNHEFGNIFLVGDAAGLASKLTGEGIYQALASGEDVAKKILNPKYNYKYIPKILKTNKRHKKGVKLLNHSKLLAFIDYEMFLFSLRSQKFINELIKSL